MKIKTLIAAAAIATVSTAAIADTTTATGEVVMIEKNQSEMNGMLISAAPALLMLVVIGAVASSSGS